MKLVVIVFLVATYLQEIHARPADEGAVQHHDTAPDDLAPSAVIKRRQARQAGVCGCDAQVYDGPNYVGHSLLIRQQNAEFTNDFFNDRVESIAVVGTCKWIFYEDANFLSTPHLLSVGYHSSAPRWGGPGNRISSGRALPPDGTTAIILFQHSNFRGRMVTLYASSVHLPSLEFGDEVSSAIVTGGSWTLYEDSNYRGRSSHLTYGEYTSIHVDFFVGGDAVSSVRRN